MILTINELIKYVSEDNYTERILWIDEGNIIAFSIDIHSKDALPRLRKVREILDGIIEESIVKVDEDPYLKIIDEPSLEEKSKSIRDKAWGIIEKIADKQSEPDIYYGERRGRLIRQAMEEFKVSMNMIYKYLRRYWQRGKIKDALLPDYENSGGKGKEKAAGNVKRGRPRKNKDIDMNANLICGMSMPIRGLVYVLNLK